MKKCTTLFVNININHVEVFVIYLHKAAKILTEKHQALHKDKPLNASSIAKPGIFHGISFWSLSSCSKNVSMYFLVMRKNKDMSYFSCFIQFFSFLLSYNLSNCCLHSFSKNICCMKKYIFLDALFFEIFKCSCNLMIF